MRLASDELDRIPSAFIVIHESNSFTSRLLSSYCLQMKAATSREMAYAGPRGNFG